MGAVHDERRAIVRGWANAGLLEISDELDRISGCDYIRFYHIGGKRWQESPYDGLADDTLFANIALAVRSIGGA